MSSDHLDTTDWKILSILQSDASIPNIDLAERVFLSPSPCSRRVKNMEDRGYIVKRVSLLDPNKVGLPMILKRSQNNRFLLHQRRTTLLALQRPQ